jgi:hypothetical protein
VLLHGAISTTGTSSGPLPDLPAATNRAGTGTGRLRPLLLVGPIRYANLRNAFPQLVYLVTGQLIHRLIPIAAPLSATCKAVELRRAHIGRFGRRLPVAL